MDMAVLLYWIQASSFVLVVRQSHVRQQ